MRVAGSVRRGVVQGDVRGRGIANTATGRRFTLRRDELAARTQGRLTEPELGMDVVLHSSGEAK